MFHPPRPTFPLIRRTLSLLGAMVALSVGLHAQSVVVLDNTGTGCAYTVQLKWGDITNGTTAPPFMSCGSPASSSSHAVGAGQVVNVPIPTGATGPCQVKVLDGSNNTVATCSCDVPNCGFNLTDRTSTQIHIDMTQAWTVKWL